MSTIAAISTPDAAGGIAIIRISGENAVGLATKIFKPSAKRKVSEMHGYTCAYGHVLNLENEIVDEAVLTVFKAPKSYTGEDVAEISCHGGIFVTRKILRLVLDSGAVPAQPGEFTKRAFLNGKLSLTQAEAVMNIISASSQNELKYASALKEGSVFRRIKEICSRIISVLADLAAWADFPEDDIPEVEPQYLIKNLNGIYENLYKLDKTYDYGKIICDGINTVIAGKPNVGKSTLMNCLSGFERSIVTDIAGTTRDVIEETVQFGELKLRLSDTAGIHETDDVVELMGVEVAHKRIDQADLILVMFDASNLLTDEDFALIERISGKKCIAIINKTDERLQIDYNFIKSKFNHIIEISAINNSGIDKLVECVNKIFIDGEISADKGIIANERQRNCLINCQLCIKNAIVALENGEMLDAVTVILDEAAAYLLELTGEKVSEAVVDEVFSHFCIGK